MFKIIIKKPIEFVKNNIEIILTVGTATATIEVSASLYFYYKNNWQNNLKNAANKNSFNDIKRKEYVENN